MTDEQIALIKYAIRAENKKTAKVLGKLKVPVDDYKSPLAKALCAALALAEQARAMEDAIEHTARRAYQNGYQAGHEDTVEARFCLVDFRDPDQFGDVVASMRDDGSFPEWQALAAANAAMKAGLPPTAEESSADRTKP